MRAVLGREQYNPVCRTKTRLLEMLNKKIIKDHVTLRMSRVEQNKFSKRVATVTSVLL